MEQDRVPLVDYQVKNIPKEQDRVELVVCWVKDQDT